MNETNGGNGENNNNNNSWGWGAGAAAGIGILAGTLYLFSKNDSREAEPAHEHNTQRRSVGAGNLRERSHESSSYPDGLLQSMNVPDVANNTMARSPALNNPNIKNLNSVLSHIYNEYINLKKTDFQLHYKVFSKVFYSLRVNMKDVDQYYKRYSSKVDFTGSHSDGLRINKPDEFDIDVVIRLPLNMEQSSNSMGSDIDLIAKSPGFVELKMGQQYTKLPERDSDEWSINKTAYTWKDNSNFLLSSKFSDWFKGLVNRALNKFDINITGQKIFVVDGVPYTIRTSSSGPALTLIIENKSKNFKMSVDIVPSIRFSKSRWPVSKAYRDIPSCCEKGYWVLVPKPNKAAENEIDQYRSWRISLHDQEKEIMHDSQNLKQGIRFLKKLRDSEKMDKIVSYYIKTLFLWEASERNDKSFWAKSNPATIFKIMLNKFHKALSEGNIPYFWNKNNNLVGHIDKGLLKGYAKKLEKLIKLLEEPSSYKDVAKYLLTDTEFQEFSMRYLHI